MPADFHRSNWTLLQLLLLRDIPHPHQGSRVWRERLDQEQMSPRQPMANTSDHQTGMSHHYFKNIYVEGVWLVDLLCHNMWIVKIWKEHTISMNRHTTYSLFIVCSKRPSKAQETRSKLCLEDKMPQKDLSKSFPHSRTMRRWRRKENEERETNQGEDKKKMWRNGEIPCQSRQCHHAGNLVRYSQPVSTPCHLQWTSPQQCGLPPDPQSQRNKGSHPGILCIEESQNTKIEDTSSPNCIRSSCWWWR